jgi:hypothetical protein
MSHVMARWYQLVGRLPVNEDLVETKMIVRDGLGSVQVERNGKIIRNGALTDSQVEGLRRFYKKGKVSNDWRGWGVSPWGDSWLFHRVVVARRSRV